MLHSNQQPYHYWFWAKFLLLPYAHFVQFEDASASDLDLEMTSAVTYILVSLLLILKKLLAHWGETLPILPIDSPVHMPSCLKLYLKKTPTQLLFAVRFTKFFRTPIFKDYLLWLLLVIETLVLQNVEICSNSQENFLDRIRYSYVFKYSKPKVVTKLQVFLRYCFNYVHNHIF